MYVILSDLVTDRAVLLILRIVFVALEHFL